MRIRTLLFSMSMVMASSLVRAQDLSWDYKPTDARIQLVMADDTHVVVEPTAMKPVKAIQGGTSWTLYFEIRGDTSDKQIIGSPIFIDFGPVNPKKLANPINIVKLEKKGGMRSWVMKATGGDFFPSSGNEIIPLERRPRSAQSADGNLTLSIPIVLPPGEYAIFTDVEAWEFTIKGN